MGEHVRRIGSEDTRAFAHKFLVEQEALLEQVFEQLEDGEYDFHVSFSINADPPGRKKKGVKKRRLPDRVDELYHDVQAKTAFLVAENLRRNDLLAEARDVLAKAAPGETLLLERIGLMLGEGE